MNKQKKANGYRGIEWTDYTWNPIGGCQHQCRWTMPDGSVAICYAELVAERVAQQAYTEGFAAHYWRPNLLKEPAMVDKPSRIFLDSMADLFGAWVPAEQVQSVLDVASLAHWHTFQSLTKNAPRLLKFDLPANVWAGVSSPPDFFLGHQLSREQQERMLHRSLAVLSHKAQTNTTWMSFEPLSWDVSSIVAQYPSALKWAVIGAASNGPKVYQADEQVVRALLDVLDAQGVPVFFKGNIKGNAAAVPWREEFPQ